MPVLLTSDISRMTCTTEKAGEQCGYSRCTRCPQAFCSTDTLAEHVARDHIAQDNHSDSGSSIAVISEEEEEEETCAEVPLACGRCAYVAPDVNRASTHDKLHVEKAAGGHVFRCKTCQFLSCSKMGLTIHKRLEHAPQK